MGLLSRSRSKERTLSIVDASFDNDALERQARDRVWNREVERLGRAEVLRRLAALSDYRGGRTGPSGFESWNRQIELEIQELAKQLTVQTPQ